MKRSMVPFNYIVIEQASIKIGEKELHAFCDYLEGEVLARPPKGATIQPFYDYCCNA